MYTPELQTAQDAPWDAPWLRGPFLKKDYVKMWHPWGPVGASSAQPQPHLFLNLNVSVKVYNFEFSIEISPSG